MKLHGTMKINGRGHLEIGGCDAVDLAKEFGTPLIVYDEALIRQTCREYYNAFMKPYPKNLVIYASKAFCTPALYRIIHEEKLGLDVVSGGELYAALTSGFPPHKIYFHGNNKSPEELTMALRNGVGVVVVDNAWELNTLNDLAAQLGVRQKILLRVTPGIEAHTHAYIKTGQIDSKFGFTLPNGQALSVIKNLSQYPWVELKGLHCHIGSQIFETDAFRHAAQVMLDFLVEIRKETGIVCEELNLGGGFGIYYWEEDTPAAVADYATAIMAEIIAACRRYDYPQPQITVEPGRSIVGMAGTTLYTVGSIKEIPGIRKYVAVDGGMADNIRPALYQARYEAALANKMLAAPAETVTITGKCCESGDMLIWDIQLPEVEPGDVLAVSSTGAYTYAMASNYNNLGRPAVVLVHEGQADLIIERETYDHMLQRHKIPPRLR